MKKKKPRWATPLSPVTRSYLLWRRRDMLVFRNGWEPIACDRRNASGRTLPARPAAQEASGDFARATNSHQLSFFLSLILRHLILTHEVLAVGPIAQRTGRLYTCNRLRKLTNSINRRGRTIPPEVQTLARKVNATRCGFFDHIRCGRPCLGQRGKMRLDSIGGPMREASLRHLWNAGASSS